MSDIAVLEAIEPEAVAWAGPAAVVDGAIGISISMAMVKMEANTKFQRSSSQSRFRKHDKTKATGLLLRYGELENRNQTRSGDFPVSLKEKSLAGNSPSLSGSAVYIPLISQK